MTEFSVQFDTASFRSLDTFALLADQKYNYGDIGDWFGAFRGGLYGFYSRLHGVEVHYSEVHAWLPPRIRITDTEYHVTTILFHMDSALECLTYALNALGWVANRAEFRDIANAAQLRRISPADILKPSMPGYATLFPTLQRLWQAESSLIERIEELHDVSKHRHMVYKGGKLRSDPPPGFYEALGIGEDDHRFLFAPAEETMLEDDPKTPRAQRASHRSKPDLLEDLVPAFAELVKDTGSAVLADARANMTLKTKQFRDAAVTP